MIFNHGLDPIPIALMFEGQNQSRLNNFYITLTLHYSMEHNKR
jgi:hypothetical protein